MDIWIIVTEIQASDGQPTREGHVGENNVLTQKTRYVGSHTYPCGPPDGCFSNDDDSANIPV